MYPTQGIQRGQWMPHQRPAHLSQAVAPMAPALPVVSAGPAAVAMPWTPILVGAAILGGLALLITAMKD